MSSHVELIEFFRYIDEPNLLCEQCYEVGFTDMLDCTDADGQAVSQDDPGVATVQKSLKCDACGSTIRAVSKSIEEIGQMREEEKQQDKAKQQ